MEPMAERLDLPGEYGKATRTMAWEAVQERLERALRYWLVTTRPDGRAHVVPVDGLWLDGAWYYGGSSQTVHQRNLERDQRVVVHLEDTMAAVILEGSMRRVTPPPELARRMDAAAKAKYGYSVGAEVYAAGVWALQPERARSWSEFPTDCTRFRFG